MFKLILLKELKDIFRDKRSLFLLVFFPLLLMTGLTFFYDKIIGSDDEETFIVAVDEATDEYFLEQLETMIPYAEIKKTNDVQVSVENKEAQLGIIIAKDWQQKMQDMSPFALEVMYDPGSQKSSQAAAVLMATVKEWESQIVGYRLTEKNMSSDIIDVVQVKETAIKDENNAMASFMLAMLIPILIPMAVANGSYPAATELFAGEKEKKTMEALLITPVKPIKILFAKWMSISLLGIFTGIFSIAVLAIEIQFTSNLKDGFTMIGNPSTFIVMSMVLIIVFALFISSLEMILSMLANTVKEAGYYIGPLLGMITFPIVFMFFLSESLNIWLYSVPVLNLFLFVRDTFSEQFTLEAFFVALGSYLVLILLSFLIANKMFHNYRLMIGK